MLIHPDDLRADAKRMREQAQQLRVIATDLDRAAAARDLAAERRQLQLARQPAEKLPDCPAPDPARGTGVTRGCGHDLAGQPVPVRDLGPRRPA